MTSCNAPNSTLSNAPASSDQLRWWNGYSTLRTSTSFVSVRRKPHKRSRKFPVLFRKRSQTKRMSRVLSFFVGEKQRKIVNIEPLRQITAIFWKMGEVFAYIVVIFHLFHMSLLRTSTCRLLATTWEMERAKIFSGSGYFNRCYFSCLAWLF